MRTLQQISYSDILKEVFAQFTNRLFTRWVACGVISDKQSARYGVRFSYPLYILLVTTSTLLRNPYLIALAALIAFLGVKLPLHPFDYAYNVVARLLGLKQIPGRGSELQVSSTVALAFNLVVLVLIIFNVSLNYGVLAITYALASIFFIAVFLTKD